MSRELFNDPEKSRNYLLSDRMYYMFEYNIGKNRRAEDDSALYNAGVEARENYNRVCLVAVYKDMIVRAYEDNESDCRRGEAILRHGMRDFNQVGAAVSDWYMFTSEGASEKYENYMKEHKECLYLNLADFEKLLGEWGTKLTNSYREWMDASTQVAPFERKKLSDMRDYTVTISYRDDRLKVSDPNSTKILKEYKLNIHADYVGYEYMHKRVFAEAVELFRTIGYTKGGGSFNMCYCEEDRFGYFAWGNTEESRRYCMNIDMVWTGHKRTGDLTENYGEKDNEGTDLSFWFGKEE